MRIETKYDLGDHVYLLTDEEQKERIITKVMVNYGGTVAYELSCGAFTTEHFDIEFSYDKDLNKKFG